MGIGELATELNTSRFVLHKWLSSAKDMRLDSLVKLADYFDCSIEYLCGRTEVYLGYAPKKELPNFAARLKRVAAECGLSLYRLFKDTKIMTTQYHQWKYHTQPMLNNLDRLSEYFGVTIDYLIGRDRLD